MTGLPTIDHPAYTETVRAYETAVRQREDAGADLERLRGTRAAGRYDDGSPRYMDGALAEAITADTEDRARAALEGAADPGTPRADQVRAQITAAADRLMVLNRSVAQAADDLRVLFRDDDGGLAAAQEAMVAKAKADYAAAYRALVDARDRYWTTARVRGWFPRVASAPAGEVPTFAPGLPPQVLAQVPSQHGESYRPALEVFAAECIDPEPVRKVAYYDQRRVIERNEHGYEQGVTLLATPVYEDEVDQPPVQAVPSLHVDGVPVFADDLGDTD